MTFKEKEKLASLVHDTGFQALCNTFEDYISILEDKMLKEQSPLKLGVLAKEWQTFRKFTNILRSEPNLAHSEVEKERDLLPEKYKMAQHYGHAVFDSMLNESDNIE